MGDEKHAPTPWRASSGYGDDGGFYYSVEDGDGYEVVTTPHEDVARLIAAAPDLLAAARAEQAWQDHYDAEEEIGRVPEDRAAWCDEERRLRTEADRLRAAALAKVEGRDE